jgi:glycosyltransferase involved in cell wall biosynthesis
MSFSVVIPLYNKALHIERAIQSVLHQTKQDFEIIVINDGSTDKGREIVENIHDARLRLINQPNQGVSVARNRGVEAANHDYIAFLDADDEWLPEYLHNIQVLINNFPDCGAYAAAIKTIRPDGQVYLPNLNKLPPEPWIGILPNFFELFQDGLTAFSSSSIVVPKNVLIKVGGFPAGEPLFEDIACWAKIAIQYPIAFSPRRLAVYHQDASNRSNLHKEISEAPFIKIIRDAIDRGVISRELRNDALEFMAKWQIFIATENIMIGNPAYARQLLYTCRQTKKYKKIWLWWRFWAAFPSGWPTKLMVLKHKVVRVKR